MKIAIVTLTTTSRRTGVAEYLINLIDELQQIDKKNQYYIFTGKDNRYMFSLSASNFQEITLPLTHDPGFLMRPLFHFWLIFLLPFWARLKKVDVIHLPNTLFVTRFFPTVITIHDVAEYKAPKYSKFRTFFRKIMINAAIKNSVEIITVSESSARDLRGLGARKVVPIHLGFTNPFSAYTGDEENIVLSKYNLINTRYVLFVGTLLKHKNVPTLVAGFKQVWEKDRSVKLVLVGAPDNDYGNVQTAIAEHGLKDSIALLNYVSYEEKLVLLKKCQVFCLISSYEGFGIPILEAQAAGVPVIANNVSSLPEIGGAGVFLVNPKNLKDETSKAIWLILNDPILRSQLIQIGSENIHRFSWNKLAEKTLKIYQKINQK